MSTTTPTRAQIDAASPTIDAINRTTWVTLIRQSDRYRAAPLGYPNLDGALEAASSTSKGRQLNAALALIEKAGPGEIEIKDDGASISKAADRQALVNYGIAVLFDEPIGGPFLSGRRIVSSTIKTPAQW